jgi:hypothetical protein
LKTLPNGQRVAADPHEPHAKIRPMNTRSIRVQLFGATLPRPLGLVAIHCWLVVRDGDACHRWEVWQTKNAGGRSVGHLHCDLKGPDDGVGGGPARVAAEWSGDDAAAIAAVLGDAARYPHRDRYRAWPGPNSNTFVAWVLRRAGIRTRLGWKALGKHYPAAIAG